MAHLPNWGLHREPAHCPSLWQTGEEGPGRAKGGLQKPSDQQAFGGLHPMTFGLHVKVQRLLRGSHRAPFTHWVSLEQYDGSTVGVLNGSRGCAVYCAAGAGR
jgi:hypothetical protein